ncbi:MAG: hypothetical protein AB9856_09710 [Cellulosilyticaceae bacterium]
MKPKKRKLIANNKNYRRFENRLEPLYKTYQSDVYKIKFKYPIAWQKNNNYVERYEDSNGFFEIFDLKPPLGSIDQVVYQEIAKMNNGYSKHCEIKKTTIGGQPTRIIIPFINGKNDTYTIISEYSEPIKIGNEYYQYIELHVTPEHLNCLIDNFEFL